MTSDGIHIYTIGSWMSPDPDMGSYDPANPQSMNRYSYVLNNPLAYVDPDGTSGPCTDTGSGCDYPCPQGACVYGQNPPPPPPPTDPDPCNGFTCSVGPGNGPTGGGSGGQGGGGAQQNGSENQKSNKKKPKSPDCGDTAQQYANQGPSVVPGGRSVISGVISAIITYSLPPEMGGGSPKAAAIGAAIGLAEQSVQNFFEQGLRFQAALSECYVSQGMPPPVGN
jgi:hypothetical protein